MTDKNTMPDKLRSDLALFLTMGFDHCMDNGDHVIKGYGREYRHTSLQCIGLRVKRDFLVPRAPVTDEANTPEVIDRDQRTIRGRSVRLDAIAKCTDRNAIARLMGQEIYGCSEKYYPFLLDWVDGIQDAAKADTKELVRVLESVKRVFEADHIVDGSIFVDGLNYKEPDLVAIRMYRIAKSALAKHRNIDK